VDSSGLFGVCEVVSGAEKKNAGGGKAEKNQVKNKTGSSANDRKTLRTAPVTDSNLHKKGNIMLPQEFIVNNETPTLKDSFNKLMIIFGSGIGLILIIAFYDAMIEYHDVIGRICAFSAVVLILSFVAYVSVNILLAIEHRAIENKIFKESSQELQLGSSKTETLEERRKAQILELFDNMTFHNSLSFNEIAREVYGQQSGVYTKRIKEVLTDNGREF